MRHSFHQPSNSSWLELFRRSLSSAGKKMHVRTYNLQLDDRLKGKTKGRHTSVGLILGRVVLALTILKFLPEVPLL